MSDLMTEDKLIIAITGGIGSGKSEAAYYLRSKGYQMISADRIGHRLLSDKKLIKTLVEIYGDMIKDGDDIDRKKLGEIAFASHENLMRLNEVVHPLIFSKINEEIDRSPNRIIFVEIPLLFESKREDVFDYIINIEADLNQRIKRIALRNRMPEEQILSRIKFQLSDEYRRNHSHFTIKNNGELSDLYHQLDIVLKKLV